MKHLGIIFCVLVSFISMAFADGEVKVDVKIKPAGSFQAVTQKVKGFAVSTPEGVSADNIEVDLTSLTTGVGLRDKHLKEHLEAEKYPIAKVTKATGKDGKGEASMSIKGLTQDVKGTYKVDGKNLEAKFPMKLSDLKITGVRYMGAGVADEVLVTITLPIKSK